MSCRYCNRIIKSTSIAVTGTAPNQSLTITIPTTTLVNLREYCLILCQSIPSITSDMPVEISNGTESIQVLCRKGNILRADQIRSRRKYKMVYRNNPEHFLIESPVCPTSYVTPPPTA